MHKQWRTEPGDLLCMFLVCEPQNGPCRRSSITHHQGPICGSGDIAVLGILLCVIRIFDVFCVYDAGHVAVSLLSFRPQHPPYARLLGTARDL